MLLFEEAIIIDELLLLDGKLPWNRGGFNVSSSLLCYSSCSLRVMYSCTNSCLESKISRQFYIDIYPCKS